MRKVRIALLAAVASGAVTQAWAQVSQVNITDPTATARAAKVEPGNRLAVQEVPPTSYYHHATADITGTCGQIAVPPTGKALIVRQVRLNPYTGSGTGYAYINMGASCGSSTFAGEFIYTAVGGYTVTFDPGIAVPANNSLYLVSGAGYTVDAFVDGYTVASTVAPVVGQTITANGTPHGHAND